MRLGALLVGLWLALSGYFQPLLLILGLASCAFVLFLTLRMDRIDGEMIPLDLRPRGWFRYVAWLGVEIVKANLAVTRALLTPRLPIHPTLFRVRASQRSLLGHVTHANSITLTPGTLSIDLHGHAIDVHSLLPCDPQELAEMDRRVSEIEGERAQ